MRENVNYRLVNVGSMMNAWRPNSTSIAIIRGNILTDRSKYANLIASYSPIDCARAYNRICRQCGKWCCYGVNIDKDKLYAACYSLNNCDTYGENDLYPIMVCKGDDTIEGCPVHAIRRMEKNANVAELVQNAIDRSIRKFHCIQSHGMCTIVHPIFISVRERGSLNQNHICIMAKGTYTDGKMVSCDCITSKGVSVPVSRYISIICGTDGALKDLIGVMVLDHNTNGDLVLVNALNRDNKK